VTQKLVGLEALAADGGSAITIGTFDGVHVGHRALIARAKERAQELGVRSCLLTWDRHPNMTLRPDRVPPLLTTQERKIELVEETGIDLVVVLPFDETLSHWPPERFVTEVLVNGLGVRAVVIGEGWRFGHKAKGDIALLEKLGAEHGFETEPLPIIEIAGEPASSSRVRRAVADGDMELAELLLGRPFDYQGEVVRGDDRGAGLGFPTANIALTPGLVNPPRGVYAGTASVDRTTYPAAINVGVNPTFGGAETTTPMRIEAYLLDFANTLYGKTVRVGFLARLRDEIAFDSAEALVEQIEKDVAETRRIAAGSRGD
jgi:riboflavin kinase/FMN adenylyltransferase